MSRTIFITSGEGQTGHLIADLILNDDQFKKHTEKVVVGTCNKDHDHIKELEKSGAEIVDTPNDIEKITAALKDSDADTVMLIPPSVDDKIGVTKNLIEATKSAGIPNVVLLSSAGCDMASPEAQPRLREFITLEAMVMEANGNVDDKTGHAPCIIRAGFYAENLLLYNKQAQQEGKLPLPIGSTHKFAPVALGDVALLAAWILAGEEPPKEGVSAKHKGQMIPCTGYELMSGADLATAASQGLSTKMEFDDIPEEDAKKILAEVTEISEAEKEYLLEYYALVREGKTNYVATHAFHDITRSQPQSMEEFFKSYNAEFKPKKRKTKA